MARKETLTSIMHSAVKAALSGVKARAAMQGLGLNYQSIMSDLSRQERHKFDADLVLPLSIAVKTDAAVNYLAQGLGGVFVRLPGPGVGKNDLVGSLALSIREFGEMMADAAQAFEDGVVCSRELASFEKEYYEALQAIVTLGYVVRQNHLEAAHECEA